MILVMVIRISIPINNETDIVIARQKGREIASDIGFTSIDLALIATAISELTRNIVTYGDKGHMIIETISRNGRIGVMINSIDTGPGIENIELALQDGYSTGNSLGLGLPGVRRLMDDFEITSEIGKGTSIIARKWMY
jgi:serine/threonine-protein kinase RsbT